MWNRIKQLPGMKSRIQDTVEQSPHPSGSLDVLNSVREQHPNMSVFHNESERSNSPAPPVPSLSPATGSRRFTLKPKKRDDDSLRIRSPSPGPQIGLPKKKSAINISGGNNSNESQRSLSRATAEQAARSRSPEPTRRPSQDLLRPSMDSGRSTPNLFKRRPSLDMLRSLEPSYNNDNVNVSPNPISPTDQFGSVRSILRDPNTPGTGQNVRFFSRDAYKVMTPDQSMDSDHAPPSLPPPPVFHPPPKQVSPPPRALSPVPRSPKSQRPTLNEVFSPIGGVSSDNSMSFSADANNNPPTLPSPDTSNIFDVSQDFQLPNFPPGLAFDLQGPSFNTSMDSPKLDVDDEGFHNHVRTSTPYVNKGKGKERAIDTKEDVPPAEVNEDIFHRKEKSPRLPSMLHERSQSFSLGQSVFFSMDGNSNRSSTSTANRSSNSSIGNSILSSGKGSPIPSIPSEKDSPSPAHSSLRSRSRALSDTVFHSMLSRSASISRSGPPPPEADINDESSADLVVYAAKTPEPDPFRANATTYYTPQTMIPVTPPSGLSHVRRASKEEAALFALQNQLAMREELCGQYEADLLAREELVEILGKKLKEAEKEDMRRKGLLRGWKKKVIELEQTCRYLEEQVESSRQESMDRSALDEASGFALTAMQEQIATLHRERSSWQRKEEMFREQVDKLESVLQEKAEEVGQLKEALWKRDESERELQRGIQAAQEQMDQLSNMSIGLIDEEELRKAVQEKEEGKEKFEEAQALWEQERAQFELRIERYEIEKASMKTEVETARKEVKDDQDELRMLKAELEAQWRHSETMSEKIETLGSAKTALEQQRGELQHDIAELHKKIDHMEVDYNDSANKCAEIEQQLAELWDRNADLEHEKNELQKRIDEDELAHLSDAIEERDKRIQELMQRHDEDLDQLEASHATNQANMREEFETELARVREDHHSELSRLKEERDQEKADIQARYRKEEEKAYQEKMSVRQERDRALQDIAKLEDEAKAAESLKIEMENLKRQVHELKNDSANKDLKITQLQKEREKDRADVDGLNIALESKQQELELIKRKIGGVGTAGATPARPTATQASNQRRQSSMVTPRSRPPSVISDSSGGRDSVMSTTSTRNKLSNEKPAVSKAATNPVLIKSARLNTFGTPTPINKLGASTSSKPQRASVEGSMGPPPDKLRASLNGAPNIASRISSLKSSTSRPGSNTSTPSSASSSTPHRRISSLATERTLAKAKAAPTTTPVSEATTDAEYDHEKENLKQSRTKIPAAA